MTVELKKEMGQIPSLWVKKLSREILKKLKLSRSELSISLVDNQKIRLLNKKYRKVNQVTDVLAFPQREGGRAEIYPELLGDIVIALPRAEAQARSFGHSFKKEVAILIVHGILHLLGFEDTSEKGRKKMFSRQEELLRWLEKRGRNYG